MVQIEPGTQCDKHILALRYGQAPRKNWKVGAKDNRMIGTSRLRSHNLAQIDVPVTTYNNGTCSKTSPSNLHPNRQLVQCTLVLMVGLTRVGEIDRKEREAIIKDKPDEAGIAQFRSYGGT